MTSSTKIKTALILICITALAFVSIPFVVFGQEFTLADGQNSTNANLAQGTVSANLRDVNDNGMTYADGTYTMTYTGNWLRSTTIVGNELTAQNKVVLDGEETDTSALGVYYDCNVKWSDAQDYRCVGIVLGRYVLPDTDETVYVSVNLQPKDNSLVFYFYKKVGGEADANATFALTQKFKNDTTYRLSVLKTANGVDVYVNGSFRLGGTTYKQVAFTDGTQIDLAKLNPVAGVNFMDINATVSNLTVKYLDNGVYAPVRYGQNELEQARNSDRENIFGKTTVKISGNQRNNGDNGLTFDGTVARMKYGGGWLRAVNYFNNDFFGSNTLVKDGKQFSTQGADVYYKAHFKLTSAAESNRTLGIIVGKTTILGQTVYVSANVIPASGQAAMYFCTSTPYDFTYEITCGLTIAPDAEYTLEAVITGGVLHVYIDGKQCFELAGYTVSAYGSDDVTATVNVSDLTPCFGVNFMDIDAEMYDFEMKYLVDYDSIYYFVEPDYPDYSKDYVYNTEDITTVVTPQKADNAAGITLVIVGSVAIVGAVAYAVVLLVRRKLR